MANSRFWRRETGASAVEFALVLPILAALTLGVINACTVFFAQTELNYAADAGARYWAVSNAGTTIATATTNLSASAAQTYARGRYHGPSLGSLAFAGSPPGSAGTPAGNCQAESSAVAGVNGYVMNATGTFNLNWVLGSSNVSLKAEACYPFIT